MIVDLENGVARYLRPWQVEPCRSNTPSGQYPFLLADGREIQITTCLTHGQHWNGRETGRRCKEGWHAEKLAEFAEQNDTISNLLQTNELIEKHLRNALHEFREKCMHIPFGIQDAVFNDALREVVYEFTVPKQLEIDIHTMKDRLSDLDGEENSSGHTKAEQEKLDKEAQ